MSVTLRVDIEEVRSTGHISTQRRVLIDTSSPIGMLLSGPTIRVTTLNRHGDTRTFTLSEPDPDVSYLLDGETRV